MLTISTYFVLAIVIILVVSQTAVVAAFVWTLLRAKRRPARQRVAEAEFPKAAVILSLRGPDPYLDGTLQALKKLDYPDYQIHLVVDSEEDPVWDDIHRSLSNTGTSTGSRDANIHVHLLRDPARTCSLKCSSLAQAVGDLDEDVEVVAFVDGDASPHRSWLRDLVAPLAADGVGVVTGNRWFVPSSTNWGTLVRYFWNVGAVIQVWLNGIVWAGSMAMRRDVMEQTGLLDAWRKALSVDATVCQQMRKHRLKVRFAPTVMMANREDIGLDKFMRWVRRQLVAAKSCGPNWRVVALHAFSLTGSQFACIAILIAALLVGARTEAYIAVAAMGAYWVSAALSTLVAEFSVRRVLAKNREHANWSGAVWMSFASALVLTHIAYPLALFGAYSQRRVSWRGIDYIIRGVNDIEMCNYEPYQPADDQTESVI